MSTELPKKRGRRKKSSVNPNVFLNPTSILLLAKKRRRKRPPKLAILTKSTHRCKTNECDSLFEVFNEKIDAYIHDQKWKTDICL